jgi:hypothetical protein
MMFRLLQLRVTAARPGTVNFELDIKQMHTVCVDEYLLSGLGVSRSESTSMILD